MRVTESFYWGICIWILLRLWIVASHFCLNLVGVFCSRGWRTSENTLWWSWWWWVLTHIKRSCSCTCVRPVNLTCVRRCTWRSPASTSSGRRRLWGQRHSFLHITTPQNARQMIEQTCIISFHPGTRCTRPAGTPPACWDSPSPWKHKPPSSGELGTTFSKGPQGVEPAAAAEDW